MTGDLIDEARRIYADRLKDELEAERTGSIVAIEVESGDYFLGDREVEAYGKAIQKHPRKKFAFLRVGARATHFTGAF